MSSASHSSSIRTIRGETISLAERLGGGGEGTVYAVKGSPDTVAKIYIAEMSPERREKLATMVGANTSALSQITAWPSDLLLSGTKTVGFLMPRAKSAHDVHVLYGMKSRKANFPTAGFKFLVHSAMNLSRAFSVVHRHSIVIGDVNERLAMVSQDATVRLIDCDSFQITQTGKRYYCDVGTPIFIPPELQGAATLRGVERTEQHDVFGLAVLIFHILFLGKHPYAGICPQITDMPLETAIQQNRYAYASDRKRTQMQAPPNSPPPASAGSRIAALFEQSFDPSASRGLQRRPSSSEWADALQELLRNLVDCKNNAAHAYASSFSTCPWCAVEAHSRLELFNYAEPSGASAPSLDVDAIMHAIGALPDFWLKPAPDLKQLISKQSFSPDAITLNNARLEREKIFKAQLATKQALEALKKTETALDAAKQAETKAANHLEAYDADKLLAASLSEQLHTFDELILKQKRIALIVALLSAIAMPIIADVIAPNIGARSLLLVFGSCLAVVGLWFKIILSQRRGELERRSSSASYAVASGKESRRKAFIDAKDAVVHGSTLLKQMQTHHYQSMLEETAVLASSGNLNSDFSVIEQRIVVGHSLASTQYAEAAGKYEALDKELSTSRHSINQLKIEALRLCSEIKSIDHKKAAERQTASEKARDVQLGTYLDRFYITREPWPKIPQSALAQLASFGIETAADINETDLQAVPGFGPVRIGMLTSWRKRCEAGFKFDPSNSIHMTTYRPIERVLNTERRQIERQLVRLKTQIDAVASPLVAKLNMIEHSLHDSSLKLAQAAKNMEATAQKLALPQLPKISLRTSPGSVNPTSSATSSRQPSSPIARPSSNWRPPKYRTKSKKKYRRRRY